MNEIANKIAEASNDAKGSDASAAAVPLMDVVGGLRRVHTEVGESNLSVAAKSDLLVADGREARAGATALNLALNVTSGSDSWLPRGAER